MLISLSALCLGKRFLFCFFFLAVVFESDKGCSSARSSGCFSPVNSGSSQAAAGMLSSF